MRLAHLPSAALPLLFALGCPSEPTPPKDDTGPVEDRVDLDQDGYFDDEDCDDADPAVFPGAEEVCNGADDDCDGDTDEGVLTTSFADEDGDGYGDPDATAEACGTPDGYVPWGTDCDDGDAEVNPGEVEVCDGVDNNCDGDVDEGLLSTWYADEDSDGFGDPAIVREDCADEQPSGWVADSSDCDDGEPAVNPLADEVCDGVDNDCDDETDEGDALDAVRWYADADGDGYGDVAVWEMACEQPPGFVPVSSVVDCDDAAASVHPGATEACNGIDDDCDGGVDEGAGDASTWYQDSDGDGFGNSRVHMDACAAPPGYVADATDCDDLSASVYPGAAEYCNGDDDDCDGTTDEASAVDAPTWYYDGDSDGYGTTSPTRVACTAPARYVALSTDCDDTDASLHPGATEVCDLIDQDCDGTVDEGALGTAEDCPAIDCVDVLADDPTASDGSYFMEDGYWWDCDMTTDGGGWLEVSTAVAVYGTGYDTQYHNIAGFSWSEVMFRYSSGSSTAGCTYPTSISYGSNPIAFQFGSEIWGLPDAACGSTCGWAMLDYSGDTTYLTTAYDFVIARAESTDTIRVGMTEGVLSCTTSDNVGTAWLDILIRR
jgi:hypothetical protein